MGMPHPSFALDMLRVGGLRNLASVAVTPSERLNIVHGDNGHGKTSLLEAIYVVCTTKSFRTPRLGELVQHGQSAFEVRARFVERRGELPPMQREQVARYAARTLELRADGNKPRSFGEYAVRSPVVVFHPEELALSTGPAALRRKLLDRVAFYRSALNASAASQYARALRARHELLRRGAHEAELAAYETLLADLGATLTRARREAFELLLPPALEGFRRIAAPEAKLELLYRPRGTETPEEALRELAARRDRDARSASATFGPHRDDLELSLNGRAIRQVGSQGQHRAVTLSLKAAESETVARLTGLEPLQLLDDVSSELDPSRTEALLSFLSEMRGQVFVTTTRPALLQASLGTLKPKQFQVVNGAIRET